MIRLDRPSLPDSVKIGGQTYPVDPDFRTVLKIVRMLTDDTVLDAVKPSLVAAWFYPDGAPDVPDAVDGFAAFLRGACTEQTAPPPQDVPDISYEYDAPEIYASFLSEYGVDLLDAGPLHWYRFYALLSCLSGDSALARKARGRTAPPGPVDHSAAALAFERAWDQAGAKQITDNR